MQSRAVILRAFASVVSCGFSETATAKRIVRGAARSRLRSKLLHRASDIVWAAERRLLVVAPHPDDESLGCGGLIAKCRSVGAAVHIAFLTDGAASHEGHPTVTRDELRRIRAAEAIEAAARLGVQQKDISFFNLADGTLATLENKNAAMAKTDIRRLVEYFEPTDIAIPSRQEGSTEHEAAFALVMSALHDLRLTVRLLEYLVWAWWSPLRRPASFTEGDILRLDLRDVVQLKQKAIEAHASQVLATPPWKRPLLSRDFTEAFLGSDEFFIATFLRTPRG